MSRESLSPAAPRYTLGRPQRRTLRGLRAVGSGAVAQCLQELGLQDHFSGGSASLECRVSRGGLG